MAIAAFPTLCIPSWDSRESFRNLTISCSFIGFSEIQYYEILTPKFHSVLQTSLKKATIVVVKFVPKVFQGDENLLNRDIILLTLFFCITFVQSLFQKKNIRLGFGYWIVSTVFGTFFSRVFLYFIGYKACERVGKLNFGIYY